MNYAHRIHALRAEFRAAKIDCLLVTSLPNIRYLTGFTGSAGLLVVTERSSTLYTDSRYTVQAAEEVTNSVVRIPRNGAQRAAIARTGRCRHVGFEASAGYRFYRALLAAHGPTRVRPVDGAVERLRIVKDEAEIEHIRRSVELNSRALAVALEVLKPGTTELDVAAEIEYQMRRMGAERPAFETIAASGPRSAMPHARATTRALGKNEFVVLDHGAILGGYASDMTRTVYLGAASRRARVLYGVVLEAQEKAIQAVRAGVACSAVDRAARQHIAACGHGEHFSHSTGHGLGLEVHEAPRIAAPEKSSLPAGAVITIEPGVYVPGFGGVRIEDVVVVRERGAEVLTPSPKALMELG